MKDLNFLQYCHNDDLKALIDIITKDKDGDTRFSDNIIGTDKYKRCYPNKINEMWWDMANELRLYGGNTFANIFRGGEGVAYKELLEDVAKKLKVNFNSKQSVEKIELGIINVLFEKSVEEMSNEQIAQLAQELGVKNFTGGKQAFILLIPHLLKQGGFTTYKIAMIVANSVARYFLGRGLTWATNAAINQGLARVIGFSVGPIMWILTGLWTLLELAAPAYRVTIPSVIMIACMRQRWIIESSNKLDKDEKAELDEITKSSEEKEVIIEPKVESTTSTKDWIYAPKEQRTSYKSEKTTKSSKEKEKTKILIDGNNLCYEGDGGKRNYIGFKALLPLIEVLKNNYDIIIFFDKSIHKLEGKLNISDSFPKDIKIRVTQSENDKIILQYAQGEPTSLILSNDNFRNHKERENIQGNRFIKHDIIDGRIIITKLDINLKYD